MQIPTMIEYNTTSNYTLNKSDTLTLLNDN